MNTKAEKLDWFPMYWQKFYIGTVKLKADEVGAYFLLLIHQWDKGFVPGTDKEIEEIARVPIKKLSKVMKKFTKVEDKYFNDTLEQVRSEQEEKHAKRRESASKAGKASAEKRTSVERPLNVRQPLDKSREEERREEKNKKENSVYETSKNEQDVPPGSTEGSSTGEKIETGNPGSSSKPVQPTTHFRTYAEYDTLGAVLKDQATWKENVQRKYKLSAEEVNRLIGAWLDHIKTLAETVYYLKDAQSFCANWIGSELRKNKQPGMTGKTELTVSPPSRYKRLSDAD